MTKRRALAALTPSECFADTTPYTAYVKLLDDGTYFAAMRTFFGALAAEGHALVTSDLKVCWRFENR